MNTIVELPVSLQCHRSRHRYLGVDHVRNEVLDDFVAAVDEALLQVHHVEEEDVEAGWQDSRHVGEPVPKENIEEVVGNEIVEEHHAAALALEPIVLSLAYHGVPDEELIAEVLVEDEVAQSVDADSADEQAPREYLAVEVLLQENVSKLALGRLEFLSC